MFPVLGVHVTEIHGIGPLEALLPIDGWQDYSNECLTFQSPHFWYPSVFQIPAKAVKRIE